MERHDRAGEYRGQGDCGPRDRLPPRHVRQVNPQDNGGRCVGDWKGEAEAFGCTHRSREGTRVHHKQACRERTEDHERDSAEGGWVPSRQPHPPDQRGRREQDRKAGNEPRRHRPPPQSLDQQADQNGDPRRRRDCRRSECETRQALLCRQYRDRERCRCQRQDE